MGLSTRHPMAPFTMKLSFCESNFHNHHFYFSKVRIFTKGVRLCIRESI
ncbi:hypothetical protein LEP1GSC196_2022 [Leptospira meyeri serovar Semaranga str. Veldrot Semarang 173]|nr:hypothetical protein LEP1GSC196_2022 [Leptospira meyeri serovar Semaranga str. Veldrot Semarang 173]